MSSKKKPDFLGLAQMATAEKENTENTVTPEEVGTNETIVVSEDNSAISEALKAAGFTDENKEEEEMSVSEVDKLKQELKEEMSEREMLKQELAKANEERAALAEQLKVEKAMTDALVESTTPKVNPEGIKPIQPDFFGNGFAQQTQEAEKEENDREEAAVVSADEDVIVSNNYQTLVSNDTKNKLAKNSEFARSVLNSLRSSAKRENNIYFSPILALKIPNSDIRNTINEMVNKTKEIMGTQMGDFFTVEELKKFVIDKIELKYLKSPKTQMNMSIADLRYHIEDSLRRETPNSDDPTVAAELVKQTNDIITGLIGKNAAIVSGAKAEPVLFLTVSIPLENLPLLSTDDRTDPNLKVRALLYPLLAHGRIVSSKSKTHASYAISVASLANFAQNLFTDKEIVEKKVVIESAQPYVDEDEQIALRVALSVEKGILQQ